MRPPERGGSHGRFMPPKNRDLIYRTSRKKPVTRIVRAASAAKKANSNVPNPVRPDLKRAAAAAKRSGAPANGQVRAKVAIRTVTNIKTQQARAAQQRQRTKAARALIKSGRRRTVRGNLRGTQ